MARTTPIAGEFGFMPVLPGLPTNDPPPATAGRNAAQTPRIERIGPVRVIAGRDGWRGIALRLSDVQGQDRWELALTAGDGRSIVVAVLDQDDAVAHWRDFGRSSGLPLLLESADGSISEPYPQIGRVALGPIRIRRRHALLAGRRPRFLARRKTARMPELPVVHRAEPVRE